MGQDFARRATSYDQRVSDRTRKVKSALCPDSASGRFCTTPGSYSAWCFQLSGISQAQFGGSMRKNFGSFCFLALAGAMALNFSSPAMGQTGAQTPPAKNAAAPDDDY